MKDEQNGGGAMRRNRYSPRRIVCYVLSFLVGGFFVVVYIGFFRHPPPEELLRMQQQNFPDVEAVGGAAGGEGSPGKGKGKADLLHLLGQKQVKRKSRDLGSDKWQNFIKVNNLVGIGWVFDSPCDDVSKQTVGAVVMMQDKEKGGVKARTYANYTFPNEINDGLFFLEVKYNGRDLYDNYWDLCTLDEDRPKRQIFCPVPPGPHSYITDNKIPGYLPKGTYEAKAWAKDQNEKVVACGFCKFVL